MNNKYYDLRKTLSYNADITIIIGARGIGKTYSLRKFFLSQFLKNGYRFVEICRNKNEIAPLSANYFDRLSSEFPQYMFKTEKQQAFIAPKTAKKKPEWKLCGYFVAMTSFQQIKRLTFNNVKYLLVDECIIDKKDKFHRYLKDELNIVSSIIDTCTRQRSKNDAIQPHLFLLGNACDVINPYFKFAHISGNPRKGYSWHARKKLLLHYVDDEDYSRNKSETLAASLLTDNDFKANVLNEFVSDDMNVMKKPRDAQHIITFAYNKATISVYVSNLYACYYVSSKAPRNVTKYKIDLRESDIYETLERNNTIFKNLYESVIDNIIRYDNVETRQNFFELLRFCGYR